VEFESAMIAGDSKEMIRHQMAYSEEMLQLAGLYGSPKPSSEWRSCSQQGCSSPGCCLLPRCHPKLMLQLT